MHTNVSNAFFFNIIGAEKNDYDSFIGHQRFTSI